MSMAIVMWVTQQYMLVSFLKIVYVVEKLIKTLSIKNKFLHWIEIFKSIVSRETNPLMLSLKYGLVVDEG